MKPKALIQLFAVAMIFTSCQQLSDNLSLDREGMSNTCKARSASSDLQKPYFADGWQALSSHSEKVAALQLDETLLKSLSTEQLVDVCMDYPLAFDCFFYNDINNGFEKVISRFNGFQELAARQDAKIEIINYYHNYVLSDYYNTIDGTSKIRPFKLSFIELMLQCKQFGDLARYSDNNNLKEALSKIEIMRELNPALQGQICSKIFAQFIDYGIIQTSDNPVVKIRDWL